MELASNMDKKNQRAQGQLAKNGQDSNGKNGVSDSVSKKNGNQFPRKREVDNGRGTAPKRGGRQSQRNARTREKVGGQVETVKQCSEYGSLQHGGSKKQNISHLLNWWSSAPSGRHGHRPNSNAPYFTKTRKFFHQRYNKDHFVQANCQFVVRGGEDYSACVKDPDHLVDWDFVEEVRLHASDEQSCPICLHPPSAAKVTRCGHVYCFPCILHYLALSDDKWRKCPICYEPVGKEDLKSVLILCQRDYHPGEMIELQLMRRERDSLIPCPVQLYNPKVKMSDVASLNDASHVLAHAKLVTATKQEVIDHVIKREQSDLENQLVNESEEPEACFIQEALMLVSSRYDFLKDEINQNFTNSASGVRSSASLDEGIGSADDLNSQLDGLQLDDSISRERRAQFRKTSESSESIGSADYSFSSNVEDNNVTYLRDLKHANQNLPKSVFHFYQASNGSHAYLHSVNSRMLARQYGSLEMCPTKIIGKVLEKHSESMTVEFRTRLRHLGHLPVACSFDLVEIEASPELYSVEVLEEFKTHLDARDKNRCKKLKDEARVEKRVQKEEDRMMGRSRGANVHLSSYKHFPNFVEEEPNATAGYYPAMGPIVEKKMAVDSEWGGSSFAGAISKSTPKPTQAWPTLGAGSVWPSSSPVSGVSPRAGSHTSTCDSEEDGERVPNFNASFSDAFAKVLDSATKDCGQPEGRRGKKGKKKKGIVLLSSGGFH